MLIVLKSKIFGCAEDSGRHDPGTGHPKDADGAEMKPVFS